MKVSRYFLLFILYLIPITVKAQVRVKIHQPPPNQLRVEHLWWVDLNNTSQSTYTVFLKAEVTEARRGLVFRASSNTFTLPPGFKRITARDIKDVRDVWYISEYEKYISRTGKIPEGNYNACIYVIDARSGAQIGSNCIHQIVRSPTSPRLISPQMGKRLKIKTPLFTWTQPAPFPTGEKVTYSIRIVEVLPGQTPQEAMRSNKPWYEQTGLRRSSFTYPLRARLFVKDRTYAWQVQAFDEFGFPLGKNRGLSDIFIFDYGKYVKPVLLPQILKIGDFIIRDITYNTGSTIDSLSGSGKSYFLQRTPSGHFGGPIFIFSEREFDVNFNNLKAQVISGDTAEVLQGEITENLIEPLSIYIEGYTVMIHDVHLWPDSAHAGLGVSIACFYDTTGCEPAELGPFDERVKPEIDFYRLLPIKDRGPFRLGETGILVISKEEVEIDLSRTVTPAKVGIKFNRGETVEQTDMDTCNTGYLYGKYSFNNGTLNPYGFSATFTLINTWDFYSLIPMGYKILLSSGFLEIDSCKVQRGKFTYGNITLPHGKSGVNDLSGSPISVHYDSLIVDSLLNLSGEVKVSDELRWGGFGLICLNGEFSLPASPYSYYSVVKGDTVMHPDPDTLIGLSLPLIDRDNDVLKVYSNDARDVLRFREMGGGWFNLEMQGMRGHIFSDLETPTKQTYLGIPDSSYYLADSSFTTLLSHNEEDTTFMKFWFVGNSAFDSDLRGKFRIPYPCKVEPPFRDLEVTSTASFAGGNAVFKDSMLILDYWGVGLTSKRGVVSVKIGEIIYTDADIHEHVHFSEGFNIIWGEMLADGGLGEFFFNHNAAHQKFDGFPITLDSAALSKYVPGGKGELIVRSGIHFNFFGEPDTLITVHDAIHTDSNPPYYGRYITIEPETFSLFREWGSELSEMDFDSVGYDEIDQNGFTGSGEVELDILAGSPLYSEIDIDSDMIKICMSELSQHDLLLLDVDLTGLSHIWGCATIEGDELKRIVIGARLETTGGGGFEILVPKAGVGVEVKIAITPNIISFAAEGIMYLYVFGADMEMSGHVFLKADRSAGSVEGEVMGVFDLSALGVDIEADGQANWYFGLSGVNYIQGRLGVEVNTIVLGAGLSGGLFIGNLAPREKVWVLKEGASISGRFGLNTDNLPTPITGAYVFGNTDITVGVAGIIEGGIEIYAGAGAFLNYTGDYGEEVDPSLGLPLPYVVGIVGVYIHGEILWGVVSVSAWGELEMAFGDPTYFEGKFGLKGCVLWVLCASVEVTAGMHPVKGFYIE